MNNYVLVKITGKDVKRFTMSLYKKGINFYKIKYQNKSVYLKITYQDYLKLMDIKTIYEIEVVKLYGFIRIKELLNTYKIFILSLVFGICLMYFLSNIIFEIEIINDKSEIRELVRDELEKYDIKKYSFVKGFYKNEEITDKILKNNRDKLEWMEIERVGNKYIVKVEQRKINNIDLDNTAQNIVAKKKGIILEIQAESGEVVKKVNDYVNPGDVIITGIIKNKDTLKDVIHAKGKIFAEVWYNVKVEVPLNYQEKKETGNFKNNFKFKFFNFLDKSSFEFSKFSDVFVLKSNLLPIEIGLYKEKEITNIDILYTSDKALELAFSKGRETLIKSLGEEDKIIYEKCLKITENDSTIIVDIFFKVKENITEVQVIDIESLKNEDKKEE